MTEAITDLQATPRTFASAGAALFWYVDEFARRVGIKASLEWGSVPMPAVAREEREATYARVVAALTVTAPEDYPFDPPLTTGRLEALVGWYMQEEPGSAAPRLLRRFAAELGATTWPAFCRECRKTRNVLRRRFQARGLVCAAEGAASG